MRRPSSHPNVAALAFSATVAACAPAPETPAGQVESFATIGDSTTTIEALALHGDKLYTTDWNGRIWRIDLRAATSAPTLVGQLPVPAGSYILGQVADSAGNLYICWADSGIVFRVDAARLGAADFDPAVDARRYINGAAGANGIAIAADGRIWISGGASGAVFYAPAEGGRAFLFADGFSPVSTDTTIGVRPYVANGAAFDSRGRYYTMNSGTGTIWRLEVGANSRPGEISKFAESPELVGVDGLVITAGDTIYATQNFRNTFSRISPSGEISVIVPAEAGLHFPAEFVKDGRTIYIANLNFPLGANAAGHRPGATIARLTLP
jgi:sugar lactone lactonase YvrE